MYSSQNTISISELRKNTLDVLEKIEESEEPITIFSHSKPVGMIMSISTYARLQLECESTFNHQDYLYAKERLNKNRKKKH
jgi:prevent-host-death family protein